MFPLSISMRHPFNSFLTPIINYNEENLGVDDYLNYVINKINDNYVR